MPLSGFLSNDRLIMPVPGQSASGGCGEESLDHDRHSCRFRAVSHEVSTVLLEVLFPE